jgi:hypothetical protein
VMTLIQGYRHLKILAFQNVFKLSGMYLVNVDIVVIIIKLIWSFIKSVCERISLFSLYSVSSELVVDMPDSMSSEESHYMQQDKSE